MARASKAAVEVQVAVVPVSVRQDGVNGHPTLMGWPEEDGSWTTGALTGTAADTAQRLLTGCLPPGAQLLQPEPRPVSFVEERRRDGTQLTLVYTAALPMALCDPEAPDSDRWVALLHPEEQKSAARRAGDKMITEVPFAVDILTHWRRALEETGAALRFLARHWIVPQLRDVYSAVWGYKQDTASFTKWALKNPGALSPLVDGMKNDDLTQELAETLALASELTHHPHPQASQDTRRPANTSAADMAAWTALSKTLRPSGVGLMVAAGAVPAVVLAGAAAVVAYRSSRRGAPAKTWYTTREPEPERTKLAHSYPPRPAWLGTGF
jgi:hypothetical protein